MEDCKCCLGSICTLLRATALSVPSLLNFLRSFFFTILTSAFLKHFNALLPHTSIEQFSRRVANRFQLAGNSDWLTVTAWGTVLRRILRLYLGSAGKCAQTSLSCNPWVGKWGLEGCSHTCLIFASPALGHLGTSQGHPWTLKGFLGGTSGIESACQWSGLRDTGLIPVLGRAPGGGQGNPL